MEPVDLGSPRHEAFGAILPFMNETIDGGDVEKEQVKLFVKSVRHLFCCSAEYFLFCFCASIILLFLYHYTKCPRIFSVMLDPFIFYKCLFIVFFV